MGEKKDGNLPPGVKVKSLVGYKHINEHVSGFQDIAHSLHDKYSGQTTNAAAKAGKAQANKDYHAENREQIRGRQQVYRDTHKVNKRKYDQVHKPAYHKRMRQKAQPM